MQDWIIFLMGLVLAIPLSVLANILTPRIQTWYNKSIFSSRQRRMVEISNEYRFIKSLRANYRGSEAKVIKLLVQALSGMVFLVLGAVMMPLVLAYFPKVTNQIFVLIWYILAFFIVTMFTLSPLLTVRDYMDVVVKFETYEDEVKEEIKKLGGNPEDLDKEETGGG